MTDDQPAPAKTPTLIPVVSSNLESVGYDPETRLLAVKFKRGGVYHYEDVDPEHFDGIQAAESAGKYFGEHLRSRPFTKI